jgi:hypothetical protein
VSQQSSLDAMLPVSSAPGSMMPSSQSWGRSEDADMGVFQSHDPAPNPWATGGASAAPVQKRPTIDEMLPPGAAPISTQTGSAAAPMSPFGTSTSPVGMGAGGAVIPRVAADTVVIPTEDGRYVAVRQKEKTIRFKGEEVEVRRLTPVEKARKRFIKNMVMGLFGIAVLAAVAIILMMVT